MKTRVAGGQLSVDKLRVPHRTWRADRWECDTDDAKRACGWMQGGGSGWRGGSAVGSDVGESSTVITRERCSSLQRPRCWWM